MIFNLLAIDASMLPHILKEQIDLPIRKEPQTSQDFRLFAIIKRQFNDILDILSNCFNVTYSSACNGQLFRVSIQEIRYVCS